MVSIRSMLAVHFMNSIHGRTCRHSFFQGCEWLAYIGGRGVSGKNLFRKKEQEFKCPVSEGLAFAILFEAAAAWHCISRVPRSHPKLFLLCDVLHALQLSATGRVNADDLEAKICRRMRKYVEVYGPEEVLPRGHFALHLAGSLRHHEILLSCFVHERRHRSVKQIADQLDCILRPVPKSMSCKWLWRTNNLRANSVGRKRLVTPRLAAAAPLHEAFCRCFGLDECLGLESCNEAAVGQGRVCKRRDVVVVAVDFMCPFVAMAIHAFPRG